ncbi:unnamed protein product [Protopolystoma xenopodis]|uniref:Cadherin domain-containing protein n=1 Tax=Protopolystoma xenopodis TaxID=117903 RepID=A0A448WPB2_9PLAT|nr:unnamed protein product [Protopolystoma xenopodis]
MSSISSRPLTSLGDLQLHDRASKPINAAAYFGVNSVSGQLSLTRALEPTDIGRIVRLTLTASDMAEVPLESTTSLYVLIDDSVPQSQPDDETSQEGASSRGADFSFAGLTSLGSSGSIINFYIIIAIVAASFLICTVLLTAICVVLRRARPDAGMSNMQAGLRAADLASASATATATATATAMATCGPTTPGADLIPKGAACFAGLGAPRNGLLPLHTDADGRSVAYYDAKSTVLGKPGGAKGLLKTFTTFTTSLVLSLV